MTKPTSVRLEDDLADQLDQLAVSVKRSRTWLIEEAIRHYVEEQSWQVAAIQQELKDHQEGRGLEDLVQQDAVMQRLEDRIRAKLTP